MGTRCLKRIVTHLGCTDRMFLVPEDKTKKRAWWFKVENSRSQPITANHSQSQLPVPFAVRAERIPRFRRGIVRRAAGCLWDFGTVRRYCT
jgi:hypothetical protein